MNQAMSSAFRSAEDRAALLSQAWSNVSEAYSRELVPRFDPWTQKTLTLFARHKLPSGRIFVPACGPGQELESLARDFPDHQVIGADLSSQMISLAKERISSSPHRDRISAEVADCASIPEHMQPLSGVFSCFGLQQMPNPDQVLLNWYIALKPGGLVAVTYWPSVARQTEPAWIALTDPAALKNKQSNVPSAADWEANIPATAVLAGAAVLYNNLLEFPMEFECPSHFFQVMVHAGPLQSRLLALGQERMQAQKATFLNSFGDSRQPFVVQPSARTILLLKPQDKESKM